MNKFFLLLCCCFCIGNIHAQSICDTPTVETILNLQLKKTEKTFRRPFNLMSRGTVPAASEKYPGTDSVYTRHCIGTNLNWDGLNLHSKFLKRAGDTTKVDYKVSLTAPVFNSDLSRCRFIVAVSYSEWGSKGYMVYYRKKGKKWKMERSVPLWES